MKNTFYSNKFDIGKHNVPFINKKVNNKYIKGGPVSTTNDVLDANGNVVIVGSHGEYKGRVNEYVTVTKISAKLVIFKSDEDGKIRDVYIDKFSKNFYLEIGANSNTSTNIGVLSSNSLPIKFQSQSKDEDSAFIEWAVKIGATNNLNPRQYQPGSAQKYKYYFIKNKTISATDNKEMFENDPGVLISIEKIKKELSYNSNTSTNIATPLPIKKETIIKDKPIKQKFSSKDIFKEQKDETIFFDGEANFENIFSNYLQKNLITFKSVQKNDEIDDIIRNYNNSIQKLS